jgi:DNA-binding CsgD family transcriptional regulator
MTVSSADTETLLLPLLGGTSWDLFLRNLAKRTGADRVVMLVRPHGTSQLAAMRCAAERTALSPSDQTGCEVLESWVSEGLGALRASRVYALDEVQPIDRAGLRTGSNSSAKGDMRIIRVTASEAAECWLMLLSRQANFSAADGALLNNLGPFIALAIRQYADRQALGMRSAAAEQLLNRLGVSHVLLDKQGRMLRGSGAAPLALSTLARDPAFACQCAALVGRQRPFSIVEGAARTKPMVLLPLNVPQELASAAAILLVERRQPGSSATAAASMLRMVHGLSAREALLAWAIAQGEPMLEAGARLGLSRETTRNYSKRIYAKTGTSGQADLARLCHTGMAGMV